MNPAEIPIMILISERLKRVWLFFAFSILYSPFQTNMRCSTLSLSFTYHHSITWNMPQYNSFCLSVFSSQE